MVRDASIVSVSVAIFDLSIRKFKRGVSGDEGQKALQEIHVISRRKRCQAKAEMQFSRFARAFFSKIESREIMTF